MRIHIEDFAQVLNVRPTHRAKYKSANFETLASLVSRIAPDSTEEFFEDVRAESFIRVMEKAALAVDAAAVARDMVERIRDQWAVWRASLPISVKMKGALEAHFQRVPLLNVK